VHGDTLWNTAVIIGNKGNIIGKHRKARCAHGCGRALIVKQVICGHTAFSAGTSSWLMTKPTLWARRCRDARGTARAEPHPARGRLQRVLVLHGGQHGPPGISDRVRAHCGQHLLRAPPPAQLAGLWPERRGGAARREGPGCRRLCVVQRQQTDSMLRDRSTHVRCVATLR